MKLRLTTILMAIIILTISSLAYGAQVEYLSKSLSTSANSLKVTMSNVDDIGAVFVLNKITMKRASSQGKLSPNKRCQWDTGNHGSLSYDLGSDLEEGENIIALVCYNLVFGGPFGGKWSYYFSLSGDSGTIWSGNNNVREDNEELKFVFFAKAIKNGSTVTFKSFDSEEREMLVDVENLISASLAGQGGASVNWGKVIQELSR